MENINLIVVFIEGIISFFSPCILPILPIYLSILSGSNIEMMKDKKIKIYKGSLISNTIFFTLGISTTFFILGSSIGVLGDLLIEYKDIIMILGGILIIIMGLFYVDIIRLNFLQQEKRLQMKTQNINPISAYILGFTFSFGWTPCIGPMLTSVLIMASTSKSIVEGNILIWIYTLGFILPFIITSIFYKKLFKNLNKIKQHMSTIKKIGGIILVVSGLVMTFNGIKEYQILENIRKQNQVEDKQSEEEVQQDEDHKIKALDFKLYDQYGNEHILSEYEGKTIFLNFWATWCPPCKQEMPYIEEIYKEYGLNKEDVVILGVAMPDLGQEGSQESIEQFLAEHNYTFPVVFDSAANMLYQYGINAFPTTFIIDKEGYISQYVPGAMDKNTMKYLIDSDN